LQVDPLLRGCVRQTNPGGNVSLSADDIVNIERLYSAYNFAADSASGKDFADCFTSDGIFDMGSTQVSGAEALTNFGNGLSSSGRRSRHVIANLLIDGEGDRAEGRAYLMLLTVGSPPATIAMTAEYSDQIVRTNAGWRFAERRVTVDRPS
jgi:hypothetical protein